ncbi:MAG: hypothetical protein ACRD5D_01450 [Candidatus Polarisedimenticolia bacterium]
MKRFLALAVVVCPAAAFADQTYTNADLARFQVPGAYTNEDLKRLPPLAVQRPPAAAPLEEMPPVAISAYQGGFDTLARARRALQFERDIELRRIEVSESYFSGDAYEIGLRPGYRSRATRLILELEKRLELLDAQLDAVRDVARRAGPPVDLGEVTW